MKIVLPFPPSVNQLYATDWKTKRRFKSKRYAEWCKAAEPSVYQTSERFIVPVRIEYRFGRPDKRKRDLSNLFKACDDLLVHHGIIQDDSDIHEILADWSGKPGFVEITILPLQLESDCANLS